MTTKPTRKFTPEEKLKCIKEYFEKNISQNEITRRYGVPNSTFRKWLGFYESYGEDYFYSEHRGRKLGGRNALPRIKKSMTEKEKLQVENLHLKIQIEQLKKRLFNERSWCKKGIRYYIRCEYEVIDSLKEIYSVNYLCKFMSVNRSGYYKWRDRKNKLNRYEQDRVLLTQLLQEMHKKHSTYGYHNLARHIRQETGWIFSDNLAHKCCKAAGIRSTARKTYKYKTPGHESVKYPNRVLGKWDANKPMELVVSDMTVLKNKYGGKYEWTYILDTYNNEIIASSISRREGDTKPYYDCLNTLIEKAKEQTHPVTLHTDQGSIYSSRAFEKAHSHCTNIVRSMSRVGTPTDNPIIESINGWIKAELYKDFGLYNSTDVPKLIEEYIEYYNYYRFSTKCGWKSPVQFRTEQGFG